jgi:vancomycin resistance protein YoaR
MIRTRWRAHAQRALVFSLMFGLSIAAIGLADRGRIIRGVRFLDTPIGGSTRAEATDALRVRLDALAEEQVELRYGSSSWKVHVRELGLRSDPNELAATAYRVGRAGGVVAMARDRVQGIVSGVDVSTTLAIDEARLNAFVARLASEIDSPKIDAQVDIGSRGTIEYAPARTGREVDLVSTRRDILEALGARRGMVELTVRELPPAIRDEAMQPVRTQLERIFDSPDAPLTLWDSEHSWGLSRDDVAGMLRVDVGGTLNGIPRVVVDRKNLRAAIERLSAEVDRPVENARFAFRDGSLLVRRASQEGRGLDRDVAATVIEAALLSGQRNDRLPVAVIHPAVTSDHPERLGIGEMIDGGRTSFAGAIPEKKWNIQLAADRLNGIVVPPGGTFSFNKELGPTTLEAGFQWGFGIEANEAGAARAVPSIAGGICQVATTLFHPVFWSGYQLEERFWHLYWIPAYASRGVVGLDVTVDEAAHLDFQWINPTNDYVLIQAETNDESISFTLYGKRPAWRVDVSEPVISNRVAADPTPIVEEDPTLPRGRRLAVQVASDGFDVVITRRVTSLTGGEPRTLTLRSNYLPSQPVTLVGTADEP